MIRNALRWIVVALIAASLLIVATIAVSRLAQNTSPTTATLQVPASNMAVLLDANGAGTQIIPAAILSVKLSPFPAQANVNSTLTLVALDPQTNAIKVITPTLEIAPVVEVAGETFAMKSDAAGSFNASGIFFPQSGEYRLRMRIDLGTDEPYSMLIAVEAR